MTAAAERWAVVGGGMLGLTLALRLSEAGARVTVFEAAPSFGGLASAWRVGEIVWDRHYHVTLLSDRHLRDLVARLGLDGDMEWRTTRTGFFTGGRFYSMSNAVEFLTFPPLGLIAKARLAATILHASRLTDWRKLERIPVADWLRRWSGARTFETLWRPLLRAKLGEAYVETSAAFIWATIARMYAARRSGLKKEMFGYLSGGYARLLDRFTDVLTQSGVRLEANCPVREVAPESTGEISVTLPDDRRERFDRVVVTGPMPLARKLCPGLTEAEQRRFAAIHYQGVICASLVLNRPLAGFYVTNITDPGIPFTAVIEMSALVDRKHFGGKALVYLPRYLPPDSPLFDRSDADLEPEFISGLRRMYPDLLETDIAALRISRARHVFAIPTLNYSAALPGMTTSLPGVYVVSSAHIVNGTLNVNETIRLAENAAAELLALPRRDFPLEVMHVETDRESIARSG